MLNTKKQKLTSAIQVALFVSAATLVSGTAFAQEESKAKALDRIEVTGSRVKRADVEGALPVTVINREVIEGSGKVSVAELLQDSTFNSFGSFTPTSGSSSQSFAEVSLRGMGGGRTLVLIDGRRAPTSPQTGEGQDLNTIPLAAVERIEVLSDGASAIYGADALAGVVNIITRKDFNGVEATLGRGFSKRGGDTEEASVMLGASGEKGRIIAGASLNNRGISYARDLPWLEAGQSTFGNNYYNFARLPSGKPVTTSMIGAVPGACTNDGFSLGSFCSYDFNKLAAVTASIKQKSVFARGDYQINDNWSTYFSAAVTRVQSLGVFAPVPEAIFLTASSPNNTTGKDVMVRHRFAALGTRDGHDESTSYDFTYGFNWQASEKVFVDFGIRRSESRFVSHGRNYLSIPVATQLMENGSYNIFDPASNSKEVLDKMRLTISRDGYSKQNEIFANVNVDLFAMGGGTSALAFGVERRKEDYADIYDAQSAAGNVGGSAGNSSFGNRTLESAYAEWVLPFTNNFEVDLAARYDSYSDFGSSTSPKVSLRFQPFENLTLRAAWGTGFRAPSLKTKNQKESFSADTIADRDTCLALGLKESCRVQINGLRVATPDLAAEESKQWGLGVVWDATDWLNLSLDYWNLRVENQIRFYSASTVISREKKGQYLPSHLYSTREPGTNAVAEVRAGYGNEGEISTDGFDFVARANANLGESGGRISSTLNLSYTRSYEVASLYGKDDYIGTSGYPKWRANLNTRWEYGPYSLGWTVNAIAANPEAYEDIYGCEDATSYGLLYQCGGKRHITHDLQFMVKTPWNGKVTIGAQNITNRYPVLDKYESEGYNSNLYNPYGRQFYMRYTQSF